eukprot:819263_1
MTGRVLKSNCPRPRTGPRTCRNCNGLFGLNSIFKEYRNRMRIDGTIIDISDPERLGDLIRIASSVPVIELIQNAKPANEYTIIASSSTRQELEYPLPPNRNDWTNEVYHGLIDSITKAFGVPHDSTIEIYEDDGDEGVLETIEDIKSAFDDLYKSSLQSLNVKVKITTASDVDIHPKVDRNSININDLLLESTYDHDDMECMDIKEALIDLGTSINGLDADKTDCFIRIRDILEKSQEEDMNDAHHFQDTLKDLVQFRSYGYIKCVIQFIALLGYSIARSSDAIIVTGSPKQAVTIALHFHHLNKAVYKPRLTVYQQLNIKIPAYPLVVRHE